MSLAIPLLLVAAIAIPVVWWLGERPHYFAGVLAFCVYSHVFQTLRDAHGLPPLYNVAVFGVLGLLLVRWLFFGQSVGHSWRVAAWFYAAWAALALAALLVASDTQLAQQGLEEFAETALVMIAMTMLIQTREGIRSVLWGLVLAGLFLGGITAFQHLTGDLGNDYGGFAKVSRFSVSGDIPGGRAMGPISTNYFGLFLVVLVPIALDRALAERRFVLKLLAGVAAIAVALAILFTYSRGAALALGAVMFLSTLRLPLRSWLVAAGTASLVAIVGLGMASEVYVSRLTQMAEVLQPDKEDQLSDRSLRGRTSEMTAAVMMFADHPWFGVGHWNYNPNYGRYAREIGLDSRNDRSAHSLYLEVAAESGAGGIVVFLTMLGYAGWSVVYARSELLRAGHDRDASAVTAFGIGGLGFLIGSVFLHLDHQQYMWMLLGISFALPEASRHAQVSAPRSARRPTLRLAPAPAGVSS